MVDLSIVTEQFTRGNPEMAESPIAGLGETTNGFSLTDVGGQKNHVICGIVFDHSIFLRKFNDLYIIHDFSTRK